MKQNIISSLIIFSMLACSDNADLPMEVYESSAGGHKMDLRSSFSESEASLSIEILTDQKFQTITGIGGSFTEASAYLLNQLSEEKRSEILEAYFGDSGAKYSLTRTHMNSCDFSLSQYSYAPVEGDRSLNNFTIEEDRDDLIPMIKDAMAVSKDGFKVISSPWTAPPWMKDNNDWRGGKLLPEYFDTWALFFSKYVDAYKSEGIDIWAFTVENEPLGNDSNWESMHFTAEEMTAFVRDHLGPQLEKDAMDEIKILGYDQNREHLKDWVDVMYFDESSSKYFGGTAIHWYASTYEVFPDALQYAHQKSPDKHLIQTEACVDAQVPVWQDDAWYWSKEATDWGWDWAPEEDKKFHPKYVPVYRYARDIIGCLNNYVDGWVDWNMVLDKQGGPNWFKNWCNAPVIVDPESDEVYYTPLFHVMKHFSRFIRPGAIRLGLNISDQSLLATAVENPDGKIAIVVLNMDKQEKTITISIAGSQAKISISGEAIQTIVIPKLNQN